MRAAQWAAVAVGFAGMLLIVRPGADLPWLGTLLMAVSAVSYAVFQVLTRKLARCRGRCVCLHRPHLPDRDRAARAVLPARSWPAAPDLALIVGLGLCSGLAQILLISAFQRVPAATLAPLNYFQLLLAVIFSTFWLQRPPDSLAMAGMLLIMAAGMFLALRR